MIELVTYYWWGGENEPPPHLKTKSQLVEMGLNPVAPVGFIPLRKYNLYLYDPNNSESVKPKREATTAQLDALSKGRESQQFQREYRDWYLEIGRFIVDKNQSIEWAKEILESQDWLILSIETLGLSNPEIIQISIIDFKGNAILNSLVKPSVPIPLDTTFNYGIDDEIVKYAPTFPKIYPRLVDVLKNKGLLIYYLDFNIKALRHCCELHKFPPLGLISKTDSVIDWYAIFNGEWNPSCQAYNWQILDGIYDAIGGCLATLNIIRKMANSELKDLEIEFLNYLENK